jgi:hypothetical protein
MTIKLQNGNLTSAALRTAYPLTMAVWIGGTFPSTTSYAIGQQGPNGTLAGKTAASGVKSALDYSVGFGATEASKSTTPDFNGTLLMVVVFTSASSRTIYFGNNTGVTETTTQAQPAITTVDTFWLGGANGSANYANADIAEAHVWGSALSAADVSSLISGTLPETISGTGGVGYVDGWHLKDFEADGTYTSIGGTRTLTASGTGVSAGTLAHPITRSTPDTTAPTLTLPTGVQTGATTATVGATTNENGTLYAVVTTTNTQPSVAQIKAGQNASGAAAVFAGNLAVTGISSAAARTLNATDLSASTLYYAHLVETDAAGNNSNIVTSASFTTAVGPDTTAPTFTGSLTVGTVTPTSIQVSWSAGTDNVGVTSYETSLDGTSWADRGNVLTYTFNGLSASTSYTPRVRAKDAAGNASTPPLQVTQSTSAATDSTPPILTGTITSTSVTQTTYSLGWSAGSDNVAVAGYEVSLDGGTSYTDNGTSTTKNVTGRTPGATDQVRVRAYDSSGNRSTPALSTSVTLAALTSATITLPPLKNKAGQVLANLTDLTVNVCNPTTGALIVQLTGLTTNGSGVPQGVTSTALAAGQSYACEPVHTLGRRLTVAVAA